MHHQLAAIVEREKTAVAERQRLVDELLRSAGLSTRGAEGRVPGALRVLGRARTTAPADSGAPIRFQHPDHDFNVVFAKAVEPEPLGSGLNLPVRAHLGVAVPGG